MRKTYSYRDRILNLGDYVIVETDGHEPDKGHVGRIIRIGAGGCHVQFGSVAEHHVSLWHPSALRIVKEPQA